MLDVTPPPPPPPPLNLLPYGVWISVDTGDRTIVRLVAEDGTIEPPLPVKAGEIVCFCHGSARRCYQLFIEEAEVVRVHG